MEIPFYALDIVCQSPDRYIFHLLLNVVHLPDSPFLEIKEMTKIKISNYRIPDVIQVIESKFKNIYFCVLLLDKFREKERSARARKSHWGEKSEAENKQTEGKKRSIRNEGGGCCCY